MSILHCVMWSIKRLQFPRTFHLLFLNSTAFTQWNDTARSLKVYKIIKKIPLTHNIPHILLTNQILVSVIIARYMFVNQFWFIIFQMAAFQIDSNIIRNVEANTKDFGFVNEFQSSVLSQIIFAVIIIKYIDLFFSSFSIKGLSFIVNALFRAKI